jgi:hypothetical protein
MYIGLYVKCSLFLSDFNKTWIFSTDFRKILKYQISWKTVQWKPSCSMRTDRQTDRHDEANTRFSQFSWTRLKKQHFHNSTSVAELFFCISDISGSNLCSITRKVSHSSQSTILLCTTTALSTPSPNPSPINSPPSQCNVPYALDRASKNKPRIKQGNTADFVSLHTRFICSKQSEVCTALKYFIATIPDGGYSLLRHSTGMYKVGERNVSVPRPRYNQDSHLPSLRKRCALSCCYIVQYFFVCAGFSKAIRSLNFN